MMTMTSYGYKRETEAWRQLVHVCPRWRNVVLGSPRRLNLRLCCTPKTPVKDTLDVWPGLPLVVWGSMASTSGTDNVIAALGQSNRVCEVILWGNTKRQLEEVLAPMQVPFPELTDLQLASDGETLPVIPDSFLDGSAPCLRSFSLIGIPFPGFPKLLLSATHLVELRLFNIPHSGYISPEAMVALLSVLSSLRSLSFGFRSSQSLPDWESRSLPPPKRSILPALIYLHFKGVTEYLEELVTRILSTGFSTLEIAISCREPDWQLSSVEQICNSSLQHPLSTHVEDLYIEHQYSQLVWKNDAIESTQWLQLLLPFAAVKNLYLSKEFAPGIAATLQELVGGRIMELLPSLQNIFVEGLESLEPFQKNIGQFFVARQLSDHPIAIAVWDKRSDIELV